MGSKCTCTLWEKGDERAKREWEGVGGREGRGREGK
jgi:hypothetical protein